MANDDQTIKNLIAVLRDGEKGFVDIGEHLQHGEHRAFFMAESKVRGRYATELERAVNRATDADIHETGTTLGAIHRVYGDLKARLGGGDHSLLEAAEIGENAASKAYDAALNDKEVSDTVRALISQQAEHVKQSHAQIKSFSAASIS